MTEKGPKAEFIDATDPEWKGLFDEVVLREMVKVAGSDDVVMQTFGRLRVDKENGNLTVIIAGGSTNWLAEQRAALKAALAPLVDQWSSGPAADLGHGSTAAMGKDPDTGEDRIVVRSAGLVRLTRVHAKVLLDAL